jgi:hypothetical protein
VQRKINKVKYSRAVRIVRSNEPFAGVTRSQWLSDRAVRMDPQFIIRVKRQMAGHARSHAGHCSLMVLAPGEVVLLYPCGFRSTPPEVTLASNAFDTRGRKVSAMNLQVQDDGNVANCGPWVAALSGFVQHWECHRQHWESEDGELGSLEVSLREMLEACSIKNLLQDISGGGSNREFIENFRQWLRTKVPHGDCPKEYGNRDLSWLKGKGKRTVDRRDRTLAKEHDSTLRGGSCLSTRLSQWDMTVSPKNLDGNCFYLSLGEEAGLFSRGDNQTGCDHIREELTGVILEHSGPDGCLRNIILESAGISDDLAILENAEQDWVNQWIWNHCTKIDGWADDRVVPSASAMYFSRNVLMLYPNSPDLAGPAGEGICACIFSPEGGVLNLSWEEVNSQYPRGLERD